MAADGQNDMVLNAIVGIAGLRPTLAALEAGTDLALANKESLVTGGELVLQAARESGAALIPVDSEHSAIFQCIQGLADPSEVSRILLTASGGPFYGKKTGGTAKCPRSAGAAPSQLGYGGQNHHRFRYTDEQRLGVDRSLPSVSQTPGGD